MNRKMIGEAIYIRFMIENKIRQPRNVEMCRYYGCEANGFRMYHPLSLNGYSKIINAVKRQRNLGLGGEGLWFFVSFRTIFSDNTRVRTFIFFPEFNIRLYDKNSESDYFFFLHQNQNIFQKKTITPLYTLHDKEKQKKAPHNMY